MCTCTLKQQLTSKQPLDGNQNKFSSVHTSIGEMQKCPRRIRAAEAISARGTFCSGACVCCGNKRDAAIYRQILASFNCTGTRENSGVYMCIHLACQWGCLFANFRADAFAAGSFQWLFLPHRTHTHSRERAAYFKLCCVPLGELVITWFISPLYLLPIERWPRINHSLVTPWIAKSTYTERERFNALGSSSWTFLGDAYNAVAVGVAQSASREMPMTAQHTLKVRPYLNLGCHWITFLQSSARYFFTPVSFVNL